MEKSENYIPFMSYYHRKTPNSPYARLAQIIKIKQQCYINDLWELIAIESVSMREEKRADIDKAIDWMLKRLLKLGVLAFGEDMGRQLMPDTFNTICMPRIILGMIVENPTKPTILVYGNLDVEDGKMSDGWYTHPFMLTQLNEFMYGRGVTSDKAPLLCWLNAMQAYRDIGLRLPINIIFVIESMAHSGSMGLEKLLQERISFFREVSCVVITGRRWLNNSRPGIIYGSRGLIYYELEVEGANRDLSSCEHSGVLFEAMPDLIYLVASMIDTELNITVEGLMHIHDIDRNVLRCADFSVDEYMENIAAPAMPYGSEKVAALSAIWGMPHISVHTIEGANMDRDIRFIIPHKVKAKFSVALAPNQNAAEVSKALQKHLGEKWIERNSPNRMCLCEKLIIPSWQGRCDTPEYTAAARAMTRTYKMQPNFIRDGGAVFGPALLSKTLNKNVIVLPIADNDDTNGSVNERILVDNYIKGTQMIANFMYELGEGSKEMPVRSQCVPDGEEGKFSISMPNA